MYRVCREAAQRFDLIPFQVQGGSHEAVASADCNIAKHFNWTAIIQSLTMAIQYRKVTALRYLNEWISHIKQYSFVSITEFVSWTKNLEKTNTIETEWITNA